jgi:hypothetical protein
VFFCSSVSLSAVGLMIGERYHLASVPPQGIVGAALAVMNWPCRLFNQAYTDGVFDHFGHSYQESNLLQFARVFVVNALGWTSLGCAVGFWQSRRGPGRGTVHTLRQRIRVVVVVLVVFPLTCLIVNCLMALLLSGVAVPMHQRHLPLSASAILALAAGSLLSIGLWSRSGTKAKAQHPRPN